MGNEIKTDEVGVAGGKFVTEKCLQDFGSKTLREETVRSVCICDDNIKKDIEEREWETVDFIICLRTSKIDRML